MMFDYTHEQHVPGDLRACESDVPPILRSLTILNGRPDTVAVQYLGVKHRALFYSQINRRGHSSLPGPRGLAY